LHLPKIHIDLQKIFNFFPKLDRRQVYYQCPNPECKFKTDIPEEVHIEKYPDKTKEVMINGKMQTVPVTYRDIVTCPKCDTHMTRKRGYKP
jgi:hypothetical protein